jgi:hypothetical protein
VVVVLPTSPAFNEAFLGETVRARFEELLLAAQREAPEVLWIRLDRLPELNDNAFYWDLIHLNAPGQALATDALLGRLAAAGLRP